MKASELIGERFGFLTVVKRAPNNKSGKTMWWCLCDCGKEKEKPVVSHDLKSGKVKSCGCLYKQSNKGRNITHGMSDTRLYRIHQGMKSRCYYKKDVAYALYGGRGIEVCDEWMGETGFINFYNWAASSGYKPDLTIDRINSNGSYCPKNCRWSTYSEQENNRRNNKIVHYCGREYTLSQLACFLGVSSVTLSNRIANGWAEHEWGMQPDLNNKNIRRLKRIA